MNLYIKDVTKLKTILGKVAWLLETYPNLKDENYNELDAMYFKEFHNLEISPKFFSHLTAISSIERAKRLLAAKYPYKYGVTKHERAVSKDTHQLAIEEWVTQN